jgi:hypothetical protein
VIPARIYLAGPAQHSWCSWFEGQHVLESFANNLGGETDDENDTGNLARYRLTYASMALDSGVYSNMTAARRGKGPVVEIGGYIDFAKRHGDFYDWCASFDAITGGAEENRRNWEACMAAGIPRLMPVFHQGEPLSLLREYVSASRFVGLGFQRPIQNEAEWLDACFAEIPENVWVHGFAMTNYLRWPFRSADSTTWMHEVLAMERESGQGRSALAYLTKAELTALVVKKYQRQWRQDAWRGTFGAAAGRGEQIDIAEVLNDHGDGKR